MTDQHQPPQPQTPQAGPSPQVQTGDVQNYPYPPQGIPGQPGASAAQPGGIAAPPARKGTMGLIALIIAVVGFLFAVIPGAMIVGWLLLPVAFILALVTFFLKDQKKALAVAALIVSIVGTIVGVIATLVVVGNAITEASGGAVTAAPAAPATAGDAGSAGAEAGSGAASDQGTRANPYPMGSTVANDEWSVTVNSFTANANEQVKAENEFNDDPAEGLAYALVNVTITRVGTEAETPLFVSVKFVSSGGNSYDTTDAMVVGPDPIDPSELYEGGTVTGNVVLQIPEGEEGVLEITPGLLADDVFVATS